MTARELIVEADGIRKDLGYTQSSWSRASGMDEVGMTVGRIYNRGDCKLTQMEKLLRPLGYTLKLVKVEDMP